MKETPHGSVRTVSESFLPYFAPGAQVISGDFEKESDTILGNMEFLTIEAAEQSYAKLPEVLVYSADKNTLFLIDFLSVRGPINERRRKELASLLFDSECQPVFITAVSSRAELAAHADEIAWGTVVWVADTPDHLIHFGGHGIIGPTAE